MKIRQYKNLSFYITALFLIFLLMQCDQPKQEKVDKTPPKKTTKKVVKEKKVEKTWDSLNNQNVEAFFTKYGAQNPETKILIETKFGDIKLRLYNDVPIHRANFVFLTKINYFNTTVLYRVAKNFVIQGGNSDNMFTQKQRRKYGNYLLEPEFKSYRTHKLGALAAAREWENNPHKLSSPFEFYIVHKRDGAHHLDGEHTVFGEVISGFSTLDKIAEVDVGIDEWPVVDIPIKVSVID